MFYHLIAFPHIVDTRTSGYTADTEDRLRIASSLDVDVRFPGREFYGEKERLSKQGGRSRRASGMRRQACTAIARQKALTSLSTCRRFHLPSLPSTALKNCPSRPSVKCLLVSEQRIRLAERCAVHALITRQQRPNVRAHTPPVTLDLVDSPEPLLGGSSSPSSGMESAACPPVLARWPLGEWCVLCYRIHT